MSTLALLTAAAAASLAARAEESGAASAPPPVLQIVAREIWVTGERRIENGLLVLSGGEVVSVSGADALDPDLPFLRHDGVLTAGMIACRTQSGAGGELQDDTRSVMPAARAAHAVDADSRALERALEAGITALSLTPGRGNLVGGLACVVATADGAVLEAEGPLAISLTARALGRSITSGGFSFGAAEPPGVGLASEPEGGPENTSGGTRGTRAPTSYPGALEMLEQLLAARAGPFDPVARGEHAVAIEAWERHEVLRALRLAKAHGLVGAIHGAPLAGDPALVEALAGGKMGVVLGPYSGDQTATSLAALARLAEAGVRVGFALDAPWNAPDALRLTAARALRAGAPREAVWKALTEDAAALTGVGDRLGRLEPGFRADLVLWSGDPLDLTSRVVAVYSDGRAVWPKR